VSKIIIACGGTGGHLAPGISIAQVLQRRGHSCVLLISQKQVDSVLVEKYSDLEFRRTPGRAFGSGIRQKVLAFCSLLSGLIFSRKIVKEEQPDMVLLFGGFLSVGLGLAARISGIPVALHEANCEPGRAVRLIKYLASRVYLPDGVLLEGVPSERIRYFGYPVREEIKHVLKADAWERLQILVPNKLLVVIGGSQGASVLNEWVIENFEKLAAIGVTVYCVTGLGKNEENTISHVTKDGQEIHAYFIPFSDAMGDVISAADLVISRAGAGSIAEIIRCRASAILVPYPYAADDHQQANALMHEQHGAGVLVRQNMIETLFAEVRNLIFNDWLLSKFKSNLTRLDGVDSGQAIGDDIEALCAERSLRINSTENSEGSV